VIALTWLVGIYAIIYGATQLYYAYRLQALQREVRSFFDQSHGTPATS
jgi:uncharacterized membrane protein HdeD (DUF308 family)